MGSNNPGRFRREGREAFEPHCDPEDFCPYMGNGFWDTHTKPHWMEGWAEAEEAWQMKKHEEESKIDEFMAASFCCPWHAEMVDENVCIATKLECRRDTCAVKYWEGI